MAVSMHCAAMSGHSPLLVTVQQSELTDLRRTAADTAALNTRAPTGWTSPAVDGGVIEIMRLQEAGWSYVRP